MNGKGQQSCYKWRMRDFLIVAVAIAVIGADLFLFTRPATVGASKKEIPDHAVTLTGAGSGMNGDVEVEVVATPEKIYKITILNHKETPNIGTLAVDAIPQSIHDTQNLNVDGVSGATITSDAIKEGIRNALISGDIDPVTFEK